MTVRVKINGADHAIEVDDTTPLLWVIRDHVGLTGTKYGCGLGLCGACTVQLDGTPTRSCITPVAEVAGRAVTTIEGVLHDGMLHPVQQAWLDEQVPQCGYCQAGQILSAIALLAQYPDPTDEQITAAMAGNLCRCGTYERIRRAIHRVAKGGR